MDIKIAQQITITELVLENQKLKLDAQREAEHHDRMVGELEKVYKERDEARVTIEDAKRALNATAYEGLLLAAMRVKEERDEAREEIEALRELLASEKITRNHIIKRSVEVERERDEARERIEKQKLEIVRLNGATNHAGGTPLKIALRERDEWAAMCGRYKQERDRVREALADWENAAAHVEADHPDEKHCGCVAILRKLLNDARSERDEAREIARAALVSKK